VSWRIVSLQARSRDDVATGEDGRASYGYMAEVNKPRQSQMRMEGMDSAKLTERQQKCLADFGWRGDPL
jgi:hypothetical protein